MGFYLIFCKAWLRYFKELTMCLSIKALVKIQNDLTSLDYTSFLDSQHI